MGLGGLWKGVRAADVTLEVVTRIGICNAEPQFSTGPPVTGCQEHVVGAGGPSIRIAKIKETLPIARTAWSSIPSGPYLDADIGQPVNQTGRQLDVSARPIEADLAVSVDHRDSASMLRGVYQVRSIGGTDRVAGIGGETIAVDQARVR